MTRAGRWLLLLMLSASGCSVDITPPSTTPGTTPGTTHTTTTTTATTSEAPSSSTTTASAACIMGDVPFGADGVIGSFGDDVGDAAAVSGFRWSDEDQCERFVIDLATAAGSPAATLGATTAELRPPSGLLRIVLPPEVGTTSIADTLVDTPLIVRAYVVRLESGGLAVDLHLEAPTGVRARAFTVGSPARVVVDLRPAIADPPIDPPRSSSDVVLLGPPAGPAEYPLRVTGYARLAGGTVAAVLAPGTPDRVEEPIVPRDGLDAWGEFTTIFDRGPTGVVELFVGEDSAEAGGTAGLRVALDLR